MSEPRTTNKNYRADIDGLRALAVVPVCFFHAGLPAFSGGFVGVSVFFVISGYLMAKLIGEGLERGDFSLSNFYERRVRRIFPALFAVLFFCAVVAAVVAPPKLFRDFGATLSATVLFASNLAFWWKTANYFDATSEWSLLLHTWSLAVEEQFYILFPIFLILVMRFGWRLRFGLAALLALASLLLSVWGAANAPTATFYLLPTRAWELLLGSLIALWSMRGAGVDVQRAGPLWIAQAGGMIGFGLVLGSMIGYDPEMAFPGAAALAPTVGAALLIYFGQAQGNVAARLLGLAPFTFIGRISYSLYLWHWPLIVLAHKYDWLSTLGRFQSATVIAISTLLAWLSWRWIEQPFRGRDSRVGRSQLYVAALAGTAVLGIVGATAQINKGFPQRFPGIEAVSISPQIAAERRNGKWREFSAGNCFKERAADWGGERCLIDRGAAENALLWGDSFAASYAPGFFLSPQSGFNVLEYTAPQCPPIIGYEAASRPQCAPFIAEVIGIIKRHDISTVIMAANWTSYIKRGKMRLEDIGKTAAHLRALGVRVVVIGQSPVFPFVYPDEYFYNAYGAQQSEREYTAPVDLDPGINLQMQKFLTDGSFFDPLALFCRESACAFKRDDWYIFRDFGHYTHYGSTLVVEALLERLAPTDSVTGKR